MSITDEEKRINSDVSDESRLKNDNREKNENFKKYLYVCSVAFMMNYAAYAGLVFLQSSMNIEEGLGTISLLAVYATSSVSTIFFIPFFIDFFGAKAGIILGEFGIIAFTAANFYPSWLTMMPASIFHGLTESASWTGTSVYVTYLGKKYGMLQKRNLLNFGKKSESYVFRFISTFYVFVFTSQVLGNAIVYAVLFGLKDDKGYHSVGNYINGTNGYNTTTSTNVTTDVDSCGAQECQSDFILDEKSINLDKYIPNQSSIYLLLSIFFVIQAVFTAVHAFGMPRIPTKFDYRSDMENKSIISSRDDVVLKPISNHFQIAVNSELKETLVHIISPIHLLSCPLSFYCGVFIAFNATEFTRGYVSCTVGVEQIGFAMVIYGLSSMAICLVCTKLLPRFGRNVLLSMVFFSHSAAFVVCLLWVPTISNLWMVYLIAGFLGGCDGIATNVVQAVVAVYFLDRLGIAYSVKNLMTNLGLVFGVSVSSLLCIHTKLFMLIGLLIISITMYIGAEIRYRRMPCKKEAAKVLEDL